MESPFDNLPPVSAELLKRLREQRDRLEEDDFFAELHSPLEQLDTAEVKAAAQKAVKQAKWAVVKAALLMGTLSLLALAGSVTVILGLLKLFGVI